MPGMPAIQGTNNWVPIGPAVVAHGQAVGDPHSGHEVEWQLLQIVIEFMSQLQMAEYSAQMMVRSWSIDYGWVRY